MSSATSEKIIRSLDFSGDDREAAQRTAEFHTGLVDDYIRQAYGLKPGYAVEHTIDSPGNQTYIIRKGSSEVVIETNFGMNTTYGPGGPRNFYTLNLEAQHRNRALDTTAEINELLVWGARAAFAVLFAIPLTFASLAIGSQVHSVKVPTLLVFGSLALGSWFGGLVGNTIAHGIFNARQKHLNRGGALDELRQDWDSLSETLSMIMIENEGFSYTQKRSALAYE